MRLMKPKVFLAGPIQGFENRQEYRRVLAEILENAGYEVVDPWMRERIIYRTGVVDVHRLRTMVNEDLKDIDRCDLFLAYMPVLSAGVCMELFYAKRSGKKTIVVCELEGVSPWIVVHADYLVKSIGELEVFLKDFKPRN